LNNLLPATVRFTEAHWPGTLFISQNLGRNITSLSQWQSPLVFHGMCRHYVRDGPQTLSGVDANPAVKYPQLGRKLFWFEKKPRSTYPMTNPAPSRESQGSSNMRLLLLWNSWCGQ
jgi:hypothetical protein